MTRDEWRWLIIAMLAVTLLTSGPYLIGWMKIGNGYQFTGVLASTEDTYSYLAKMRIGAGGNWLYQNPYAVEPHPPTLLYLLYQSLGIILHPDNGAQIPVSTLAVTYHIFRSLAGVSLLVAFYVVIRIFVEDHLWRRITWVVIVFCGGLGWLLLIITGQSLPFGAAPFDLYMGEAGTIVPLMFYPHVLFARACLLGGIWSMWHADQTGRWQFVALAGGLWLLATIGVPFDILSAGGIMAGWLLARWIVQHEFPRRLALTGLLAGLPGAVFNVVTLVMIGNNAVYADWASQNRIPVPHGIHILSLYGLQMILAVYGLRSLWLKEHPQRDILTGWLISPLVLMFIPIPFQFRLIEGFYIPLLILAVMAVREIRFPWRYGTMMAFAFLLPSTLLVLLGSYALPLYLPATVAYSPDDVAVANWMRANMDTGSVVLSSQDLGVQLPALAPVRVVIGHGFETPNYSEKKNEVREFYQGKLTDTQRTQLLNKYHVGYVIYGPAEQRLACGSTSCKNAGFDTSHLPLRQVAHIGPYLIFEVLE